MPAVRTEFGWWWRAFRHTFRVAKGWVIAYAILWLLLGWVRGVAAILLLVALAWALVQLWRRSGRGTSVEELGRRRTERDHARRLAQLWPALMISLSCYSSDATGNRILPAFSGYVWDRGTLRMRVSLPLGMTALSLAPHADAISVGLGARCARLKPIGGGVELLLSYSDALEQTVTLPVSSDIDLAAVPMGLREDGSIWTIRLGPQTLVAGASGSGKASLIWSFLLGLAPAIHCGLVEVHGIDLKGAMELSMGASLLTRFASTPEQAVVVLEEAVAAMQTRAQELAGVTRQHRASLERPHVVVLIDELAALTAYLPDRELQRRANSSIALLCSQGRAVGYTVFACLQDPRKETIPSRGLFTQTIGLRLRDATETAMVLGEGMRDQGVLCHRIPATTPGVAYMVPDDGSEPIRVRAAYVDDDGIRSAARTFAAPRQIPVVVPAAPETAEPARRPRSRRRTTVSEGEQE